MRNARQEPFAGKSADNYQGHNHEVKPARLPRDHIQMDVHRHFCEVDDKEKPGRRAHELVFLHALGNEIYAHMTEALWRVQATQQQLNVGPEIVFVGSGNLFSQVPVQLYVTQEGYGGLQFKEASIQNEYGYFWVDATADKIHHLMGQNQIKEICCYLHHWAGFVYCL